MKFELGCACCGTAICEKAVDQRLADNASGLPDNAADIVPGSTLSTVTLPFGGPIAGAIDTLGDHDWYRVSLVAGQTYTFRTSKGVTGSVADTLISLRNSIGASIATNDDAGAGDLFSQIIFTATATGVYYLDVGTYNNAEIGTFRVSASTSFSGGGDIVAGDTTTNTTLAIGSSTNGNVNALGDRDWFAVNLTAGQAYTFQTNATGGADVDSILSIHSAAGTVLGFNDDGGGGTYSSLRFLASTTGTYYVSVGGYGDDDTGAFNLSAALAPPLTIFTNDQIADQLINGYWGGAGNARHFAVTSGGILTVNVSALTFDGQFLARQALGLWADVTGITFSEVASGAQITFDDSESGAFATATRSGNTTISANVNVSTAWLSTNGTGVNSYSLQTYVHEIGHALGLGHGGNYNGNAVYNSDALYLNDSWATTIMSYFDQSENTYFSGQGFTRQFALSPLVGDIIAVSQLYGISSTTRTGDTTYGFGNTSGRDIYDAALNARVTYTVYDNGGNDTLDYSGYADDQRINLNAETYSNIGAGRGNVSIARGVIIENANAGSGNDTIIGNNVANILRGGEGGDTLIGGLGADTLDGGTGDDTASFAKDVGGVFVNLATGLGFSNAAQGDTFISIENLTGTDYNDAFIGTSGINILNGGLGDDLLLGGLGPDRLFGGVGSDTADYSDNQGDVFVNLATGLGYNNAAEGDFYDSIENLTGGAYRDFFLGDSGANIINGADGNDYLLGGLGADQLIGGTGNDTASYEDNQGAVLVNLATGQGVGNAAQGDTFSSIENVIGTAYQDTLIGDAVANILNGAAGNDTLTGNGGADQFRFGLNSGVDTISDFITGVDKIALDGAAFAHSGVISFVSGTGNIAATTSNSTFLYHADTGILSYDADGNGGGAAIDFANIGTNRAIGPSDFMFF